MAGFLGWGILQDLGGSGGCWPLPVVSCLPPSTFLPVPAPPLPICFHACHVPFVFPAHSFTCLPLPHHTCHYLPPPSPTTTPGFPGQLTPTPIPPPPSHKIPLCGSFPAFGSTTTSPAPNLQILLFATHGYNTGGVWTERQVPCVARARIYAWATCFAGCGCGAACALRLFLFFACLPHTLLYLLFTPFTYVRCGSNVALIPIRHACRLLCGVRGSWLVAALSASGAFLVR